MNDGEPPLPSQGPMIEYYNGHILQAGGYPQGYTTCNPYLYRYSLENQFWEVISNRESIYDCRYLTTSFIYKDEFYITFGWLSDFYMDSSNIIKINLIEEVKNWKIVLDNAALARDSHSSTIAENCLYLYGGYYTKAKVKSNQLTKMKLETMEYFDINPNILIPKGRYAHSMHLINSELYVFGGKDSDQRYNEIWIFNPTTTLWRQITGKGTVPSARIFHAADAKGDALLIWGGEDSSGLKDDMYIFNVITSTWTQLNPLSSVNPSAAKGACLVFSTPMIYIYGGIVSSDISNSLWQYELGANIFTLVSSSGLRHTSYSTCYLIDQKFYVAFGSMHEEAPSQQIAYFDLNTKQWVIYHSHESVDHDSAMSIQIMINNKLIRIGGEEWMLTPSNTIDISGPGNDFYVLSEPLSVYCYASGFAYFNKSVYVFGGGSVLGLNLRSNVAMNLMMQISMEDICKGGVCDALCSLGTYEKNGICHLCLPGSYAEGFGNTECVKCEAGTYSSSYGATSNRQCLPCEEGTYAPRIGSSFCISCPVLYSCPVGSKAPIIPREFITSSSVQPTLYTQPNFESTLTYFQLSVGLTLGFTLVIILSIEKTRNKLEKIDIYKDKHNTKLNEYLLLKQTKIGGCFSVLFLVTAIILMGSTFINFSLGNIQESKGLVPLVVLEADVDAFQASEILIIVWLNLYGGECAKETECLPEIYINRYNFICEKFYKTCELSETHSCVIKLVCLNGEIHTGAYLTIELTEKLSYSSTIQVNITSSSSVPNKISSMFTAIWPDSDKVFIGPTASEFFFTATPSLFKSESSDWPSKETGYHFSSGKGSLLGSQYKPEDLPSVSYLRLSIYIEKSTTALLTTRYFKQEALYFLSSLLGSVFGLMGVFGGIMKSFEAQVNKFIDKKEADLKNFKTVYIKRKALSREMKDIIKSKYLIEIDIPENAMLRNTSTISKYY